MTNILFQFVSLFGWLYVNFMLPYCFLPFPLLTWEKIAPALAASGYLMYKAWGGLTAAVQVVKVTRCFL